MIYPYLFLLPNLLILRPITDKDSNCFKGDSA